MRHSQESLVLAPAIALVLSLAFGVPAAHAQQKPAPGKPPAKADPPREHRPFLPPPGMTPPGMPPALQGLQDAARHMPWRELCKPATDVALSLLSGNSPKLLSDIVTQLLSGNRAKLLSEISPSLLSGNKPEILSGNEVQILSGNRISIFSNIKIEIHITGSGNQNGPQGPPPPREEPAKRR